MTPFDIGTAHGIEKVAMGLSKVQSAVTPALRRLRDSRMLWRGKTLAPGETASHLMSQASVAGAPETAAGIKGLHFSPFKAGVDPSAPVGMRGSLSARVAEARKKGFSPRDYTQTGNMTIPPRYLP